MMRDTDLDDLNSGKNSLTAAFVMSIVHISVIVAPIIVIACFCVKCRTHCFLKWFILGTFIFELGMSIGIMITALLAADSYTERADTIREIESKMGGCMDDVSVIPDSVIKD